MSIVLDGTTGVTAPAFDGTLDATDLTGDVAAARITTALNVTGAAPMFACRAFVNFNGTGTVAIRASGNVSSITDNGVGDYTVNFATAMPDVNYSVTGTTTSNSDGTFTVSTVAGRASNLAGSVRVQTAFSNALNNGFFDPDDVSIAIFR